MNELHRDPGPQADDLTQVAYVAQMEDYDGNSVLAVFEDKGDAAGWLTQWNEANDSPARGWKTTAWPALYVPRGGTLPDPADQAPERTARERSWELGRDREAGT